MVKLKCCDHKNNYGQDKTLNFLFFPFFFKAMSYESVDDHGSLQVPFISLSVTCHARSIYKCYWYYVTKYSLPSLETKLVNRVHAARFKIKPDKRQMNLFVRLSHPEQNGIP